MIVPSRRWLVGALFVGVIAVGALWWPAAAVVWVAASVLWVLLLAIDGYRVTRFEAGRLSLTRTGAGALSLGRPLPVRYHWRSPGAARLWVRESAPPEIGLPDGSDRIIDLRPDRDWIEERRLDPRARGRARRWRFDVRVAGPWGLCWRQLVLRPDWEITVYPALRNAALAQLPTQSRIRREVGLRQVRRIGEGRLFESLREWVPGDEMRAVDWKASAKRGKLIARQYEAERRQRVMIALDAGRMLTAETEGRPRLEDAVEAVAQLAYRAVGLDDDVGLIVFSDDIDHFVPPVRGRRALRAILDALALVQGRLVESDYPRAFAFLAAQARKRALTVLFTDVIDRFASDALVTQVGGLRPRHVPVAVTLRDLALERLAVAPANTVETAFERAAAEQLLLVRNDALTDLRSRGVIVVDAHPEAAAKAVVDCYVGLKRRALI
ncbi:MAG: DUF58 domain-containing protein [Gemmatimonadales bacterium]